MRLCRSVHRLERESFPRKQDLVVGANYECVPVGAVTHCDEPGQGLSGVNDSAIYFGLWAAGKNFGIAAWASQKTERFQPVGDPFVTR